MRPRHLRVEQLERRIALDSAGFEPPGLDGALDANQLPSNAVPGQYIVSLKDGVDAQAFAKELRGKGRDVGHVYDRALNGLSFRGKALGDDPRVELVEPDLILTAMSQTLPTGVDRLEADANAIANDDPVDVDVAVIDTGIDDDHPDLNVAGGHRFYTVNSGPPWARGSDDDGNFDDDNGHGSHVAGTIAALDNGEGVVGVAPGARLWGVKVLDSSGSGYLSDIIAGVDWVTENADKIEVANMSLGGQGQSSAFREAIQKSVDAGVVYYVAAGNSGADVYGSDGTFDTSDDFIPASYPEVAAVSALADSDGQPGGDGDSTSYGSDDSFASFSNFSNTVVDCAACVTSSDEQIDSSGKAIDVITPGVDILSTYMDGQYAVLSGTSMASPHAAGLAALYIAEHGRATNAAQVYDIRQAVIDGGVAQDSDFGLATLNDPDDNLENLGWATEASITDVAVSDITAPTSVVEGDTVNIDVTVSNTGTEDVTSDITVTLTDATDTDTVEVGSQTISGGLAAGASDTFIFSWDTTTDVTLGEHTLTATHDFADDENDGNNSQSTVVTVEEETTDIAVSQVSAPSTVTLGETVTVEATIENTGNQDVTSDIEVTLTDDGATVGSPKTVSELSAGESAVVSFSWDTTDVSVGEHTLTASHNFTDDDGTNDSSSTTVEVVEVSELSVTSIDPNEVDVGGLVDVTITGTGFEPGLTVEMENGSGPTPAVTVNSVSSDGTEILATVTTKDGGPPRDRVWDVRVTNPDGSSVVLADSFTVVVSSSSGVGTRGSRGPATLSVGSVEVIALPAVPTDLAVSDWAGASVRLPEGERLMFDAVERQTSSRADSTSEPVVGRPFEAFPTATDGSASGAASAVDQLLAERSVEPEDLEQSIDAILEDGELLETILDRSHH